MAPERTRGPAAVTAQPADVRDVRTDAAAAEASSPRILARLLTGRAWLAIRVLADVVALSAGCVAGLYLRPPQGSGWLLALFVPLALVFLHSRGRYMSSLLDMVLTSAAPGFGAVSISAMMVLATDLLMRGGVGALGPTIVATWFVSFATVGVAGLAVALAERGARRRGILGSPTVIVGADRAGIDIALRLGLHPAYGMRAVGFLDSATGASLPPGLPPLLGDLDALEAVARRHRVRNVIIGFPEASERAMLELVRRCDALGLETNVVPRMWATINSQTRFEYLGTLPLLNLRAIDLGSWRFAVKHGFDRVAAALALTILSPLLVVIALAVRRSSPGPIFFAQRRAGRDGRVFALLKFRTMTVADDEAEWALSPDLAPGGVEGVDRRTRVGRFLRRTSLDELPQLVNVLRGEMSLVGPRPERPEFAEVFRRNVERYHERHRVRAGITGWAQVHGSRGQTSLAARVELDNFYIEHWSLALDAKILLLTIPALLRGS
jgi:exopolysaccharide biosynthesis polyprenyl glycosylphosphotransferase